MPVLFSRYNSVYRCLQFVLVVFYWTLDSPIGFLLLEQKLFWVIEACKQISVDVCSRIIVIIVLFVDFTRQLYWKVLGRLISLFRQANKNFFNCQVLLVENYLKVNKTNYSSSRFCLRCFVMEKLKIFQNQKLLLTYGLS